jgi:hypothetical protein
VHCVVHWNFVSDRVLEAVAIEAGVGGSERERERGEIRLTESSGFLAGSGVLMRAGDRFGGEGVVRAPGMMILLRGEGCGVVCQD